MLGAGEIIAQGDVLIEMVDEIPEGFSDVTPSNGDIIVAHSETGSHHTVGRSAARLMRGEDPFTCYLQVTAEYADLVNLRDVNPHTTVRFPTGFVKISRQREGDPERLRMVED